MRTKRAERAGRSARSQIVGSSALVSNVSYVDRLFTLGSFADGTDEINFGVAGDLYVWLVGKWSEPLTTSIVGSVQGALAKVGTTVKTSTYPATDVYATIWDGSETFAVACSTGTGHAQHRCKIAFRGATAAQLVAGQGCDGTNGFLAPSGTQTTIPGVSDLVTGQMGVAFMTGNNDVGTLTFPAGVTSRLITNTTFGNDATMMMGTYTAARADVAMTHTDGATFKRNGVVLRIV